MKTEKRQFFVEGIEVRARKFRSAKRIARAVLRGEMTPDGKTILKKDRK